MMQRKKRIEILFIGATFTSSYLFIAFLFGAQYPAWWTWLVYEQVPLTWLESSLLLGSSFFALICFLITYLRADRRFYWWSMLALLFLLLSFDERFAIHERVRDIVLAPRGIRLPLISWTSPGDFLLLLVMIAGLLMLPKILALFRYRKIVYYFFITGVVIASLAIIMDSFDVHEYSVHVQRVEQFVEEVLETTAMLFFMNTFFLRALDMLDEIRN